MPETRNTKTSATTPGEGERPALLIIAQHLKTFFSWAEVAREDGPGRGGFNLPRLTCYLLSHGEHGEGVKGGE